MHWGIYWTYWWFSYNIPQGTIIFSFNFADEFSPSDSSIIKQTPVPGIYKTAAKGLVDTRRPKPVANVATSLKDDEAYTITHIPLYII